jgi:hypothetical protein
MPAPREQVMFFDGSWHIGYYTLTDSGEIWDWWGDSTFPTDDAKVTHWMSIPADPTSDQS